MQKLWLVTMQTPITEGYSNVGSQFYKSVAVKAKNAVAALAKAAKKLKLYGDDINLTFSVSEIHDRSMVEYLVS